MIYHTLIMAHLGEGLEVSVIFYLIYISFLKNKNIFSNWKIKILSKI